MRYLLLLIALGLCTIFTNAQNYLITFTGTGATTTVSTVKVENLTANTFVTLNGSDILRLTGTTGINSNENKYSSELKIYPNPTTKNSTIEIIAPVGGDAVITILDLTGKMIYQSKIYLGNGMQDFLLSGLNSGFYLINVKGISYQYSGKLLCNGNSDGTVTIEKISNRSIAYERSEKVEKTDYKGVPTTVDMPYNAGDRLKFTGISGNYSTVKTDIPTGDKTITFNFIACTDGDNNNYPVVQIGTQLWMAENLKATKYNDGSAIPIVTDETAWEALSTSGYCWYNNDVTNKSTYGALYNWFVVNVASNGGKNVCPTDWHVPTDEEWTTLTTYLGGEGVAGGKLKETGTIHWWAPNVGATNSSGFTALPSGTRSGIDPFSDIGKGGVWWSSIEYSALFAISRFMFYNNSSVGRKEVYKLYGLSARCIKDNPKTEEAFITSSGGTYSFFNDSLVLNIPANAVENPTVISIRNITNDLPEEMKSQIPLAFEFLPDGLVFKEPIQFDFKVPENIELDTSAIFAPFNLNTGWAIWHESKVNLIERTISTEIEHFSTWIYTPVDFQPQSEPYTFNFHTDYMPTTILGIDSDIENQKKQIKNDIERSFKKWEAYTNLASITFLINTSLESDIMTKFMTEQAILNELGLKNAYGTGNAVVAWNWRSGKRLILLNDKLTWFPTIGCTNGYSPGNTDNNIERIVEHEIGHFLGSNKDETVSVSVMRGLWLQYPIQICSFDLNALKSQYPEIRTLTKYQTAIDIERIVPTNSIANFSPGQILLNAFTIRVIDESNKGVPGATVVFRFSDLSNVNNVGSVSEPVITTNEDGYGILKSLTLPDNIGEFSLKATIWVERQDVKTIWTRNCDWTISINPTNCTVLDIEGNNYKTIQIGSQTWMAENLKTTKYNDGTAIPNVADGSTWSNLTSPGYCWYNNDAATYKTTYGALYNWYTVNTEKLCPTDWHVPSDAEWITLTTYLGGEGVAGGKLKESGTAHWTNPNTGGTNESGFTSIAAGARDYLGKFCDIDIREYWWTSTGYNTKDAWPRYVQYDVINVFRAYGSKANGFYVRCIKNVPPPTSGLVAYYPFNGNANDESGNGNNGTVSGALLTTDRFGKSNQSYNFNTANETKIAVSPFSIPSLVTISVWFYPVDNGPLGLQNSVLLSNHAKFVNHDAIDIIHADGKIIFRLWNSSGISPDILSNDNIQINCWHHLVCQVDELKNIRMYLDGKLQSQSSVWSGTYSGQTVTNIGNYVNDDDNFDGVLDDIRIYDRALTQHEITELFNEK
jgi:uncharacterized protein (TIGR02145 family)